MTTESTGIRLQKVLAAAGIASRRAAEELIAEGRVEVNGKVVMEQGTRVDPQTDTIRVDGSRIRPTNRFRYVAFNKPRGIVSTLADPEGRPSLEPYLAKFRERLFHVGRLDTDTEGLLLLTNHGDLAHRLTHPSYQVPKTYVAEVSGVIEPTTLKRLRGTVMLEDGPVSPDSVRILSQAPNKALVEIVVHEGRNRIVRRTMEAVGHPVRKLSRIRVGPVKMGQLKVGATRDLTDAEVGALLDTVGL